VEAADYAAAVLATVTGSGPVPVLLMVRELHIGGTERQCTELARALDRRRFTPHVGCLRASGFRAEELRRENIPLLHIPIRSFRSVGALQFGAALRDYIRRYDIRIVHTFDYPMNLVGAPAARWARAPVVITSQRASRHLTPRLRPCLRFTDRLADGVVVNSEAVRRELLTEDDVPPEKIHLCRNAIDTNRFHPTPRDPERDCLTIGVICALRPEKGLPTLLEAFQRVRDLRPGMRLLVVGSGPMQERLERQAAALGLGPQCHFEPATSDVPRWLEGIDIFVLPSLSEAFSNSLMEAMACGCCPIASRVGGNPELIDDARTGLLFQAGSSESLAECLTRVIHDAALRRRLAEAAAQRIQADFSLAVAGRRLGEIYEALLSCAAPVKQARITISKGNAE
jgi:glycosyltransferase involved in cell wall biosynthesis